MNIAKIDWSRLNERETESLLHIIKVEGPDLNEFAEKMCANEVTLW